MSISVIIPVHNGAATLGVCLDALAASSRLPDEIIVADDSSTDTSAAIAEKRGAQVLSLPNGPHGPAFARNQAVKMATGDVLVFLDADVAVHADALGFMESHFMEQPAVGALFGSYDASPPAKGLVTRYKNLLHHYVHQHGRREADTFWAGCAAIRRSVFEAVGGFDEAYRKPSIEDIELGARLRRAGHRIWLCPDVQGTHLKRWTFTSWLRTDIFARAIPWTQLILKNASLPNALNLDWKSRVSALCAWGAVICFFVGFCAPWAWLGLLVALGGLTALNADLLRFFWERGGAGFAAGAAGLHLLYFLYSSLTYIFLAGPARLARHGLALLLVATLIKGLAWSVIVPPWHSYDEPQHFLYGQSVERRATLRVPPGLQLPRELWGSAHLAQLDTLRFHPDRHLDLSDGKRIADAVSENDLSAKRSSVADPTLEVLTQANFYRYHPPLYYALLAGIQLPLEDKSIAVRLLACRWLSVLMGLGLVVLAYGTGRALWPGQPDRALLLGTIVSFQPMVTFTMSTVTNSALETLLFSAVLYVSIRVIRRGLTIAQAITLGVLTGLGLLTKMSFLSSLPLIGVLFLWDMGRIRHQKRLSLGAFWPWIIAAFLPLVISGWWYHDAVQSGGDSLVSSYGKISGHSHGLLWQYMTTFPWAAIYGRLLASYWGAFGSTGTILLPRVMRYFFVALAGLAVFSIVWRLIQRTSWRGPMRRESFLMLFLGLATLCVIFFYMSIDFRIAQKLGGHFWLRGQYYLPPIIAQTVWLIAGLELALPKHLRRIGLWLLGTSMLLLNLDALFGVILQRYYSTGHLKEQLALTAILQPVNPGEVFFVSGLFLMFSFLLMAALTSATRPEQSLL